MIFFTIITTKVIPKILVWIHLKMYSSKHRNPGFYKFADDCVGTSFGKF
jgi:hypothetical protein